MFPQDWLSRGLDKRDDFGDGVPDQVNISAVGAARMKTDRLLEEVRLPLAVGAALGSCGAVDAVPEAEVEAVGAPQEVGVHLLHPQVLLRPAEL